MYMNTQLILQTHYIYSARFEDIVSSKINKIYYSDSQQEQLQILMEEGCAFSTTKRFSISYHGLEHKRQSTRK